MNMNIENIAEIANNLYMQSKSSKLSYEQRINLEDTAIQLAETALENGVGHKLDGDLYYDFCQRTGYDLAPQSLQECLEDMGVL